MWGKKIMYKGNGGLTVIREIEGYKYPPSFLLCLVEWREEREGDFNFFSYLIEEEFQTESEIKCYQNIQT